MKESRDEQINLNIFQTLIFIFICYLGVIPATLVPNFLLVCLQVLFNLVKILKMSFKFCLGSEYRAPETSCVNADF